jgi:hypothetical protein
MVADPSLMVETFHAWIDKSIIISIEGNMTSVLWKDIASIMSKNMPLKPLGKPFEGLVE